MPTPEDALPGREERIAVPSSHFVLGTPLEPPFPEGTERAMFGMGCFWGAERDFWEADGVYTTAVGYAGGYTPNPTYEEVCSGRTGHNEVVLVVYRPADVSYDELLRRFWEGHDPLRGCARATTSARSTAPASTPSPRPSARPPRRRAAPTASASRPPATARSPPRSSPRATFYYAEDYHQQYLAKNPGGYCGIGGTGVSCPVGVAGV